MITNYDILEVNLYDDIYIIKDKHNMLTRKYKSTDIEKFTKVKDAYNVLGNKKTRLDYDIQLYNDYLDSMYKSDNIVNIAYLYYRNNENEKAIKLLLNINQKHKNYFDALILLSKIYKETEIINKKQYNDSEKVLLNLYEEYKDKNNLNKAIILIELIDLYYLMNSIKRVSLLLGELKLVSLPNKKELKYIENREKELKKKYKDIEIDIVNINEPDVGEYGIDFGITKLDDIKKIIEDFIEFVNYEIDNGFTEKIKINRKLERLKHNLVEQLTEALNIDSKTKQNKYLEETLKLVDNAINDIDQEIIALKNIKEEAKKIIS